MSKAFTRESDDAFDEPAVPRPASILPPGAKNYMTPEGAERLRNELARLTQVERPRLAEAAENDDSRRALQALGQRILHIEESLRTAVVVSPSDSTDGQVRFGATVRVREPDGEESCYRIVGMDEADPDRGWLSWMSPLARALLNARAGERVRFRAPAGDREIEILGIAAPPAAEGKES